MYKPRFDISPELLRLITEATELRGWIGHAVVDVSWLPKLQTETAARLAHSSTAIEGNPLTLPDVQALARGEDVGSSVKARREILNYLAAMRWIWNRKAGEAFGEEDLLRLHRLLTEKTMSDEGVGRYKTRANRIVDAKGRTIYTPPGPAEAKPLTRDLLDWVKGPQAGKLHAIAVAAIAHHRLVSIHPFSDGNGRAARALETSILYTRGFDTHHLFALDEFFWEERQVYYDKIQQVRDLNDDMTYWLDYVAEGVVNTLRRTKERIGSLKVSTKAPRIILTRRQEELLRLIRDRGRVRSPDVEKAFNLTRARVGQIIKPLVDAGLVVMEGQTRATSYRLSP